MLSNFRAALVTALVIPVTMLMLAIGMYVGKISANLMSLGALDFGLIADGAIIVAENSLRRLAERQHALGRQLTVDERLDDGHRFGRRDAAADGLRPGDHHPRLFADPHLLRRRGQDVSSDGDDRHHRARSEFILSLTFFPAMIAICVSGQVGESENVIIAG